METPTKVNDFIAFTWLYYVESCCALVVNQAAVDEYFALKGSTNQIRSQLSSS